MIGDSDLDSCFSTDDFGVEGSFSNGGPTVNGYFTNATEAVSIGETMIEATDASFTCRTSLITTVRQGHTVTIDAVVWTIKRILRTGTGVSVCYLKS